MNTVATLPWRLTDRLARSLDYAGLKPKDMAAHLRTHPNTVLNYIAGRTHIPYPALVLWADRTGVALEWFIDGEEDAAHTPVTLHDPSDWRQISHLGLETVAA